MTPDSMRPAHARARETYVRQDVSNESPLGLVARIYQIATLEARRAAAATGREDWIAKGRAVGRLLRALTLLQNSLDPESGATSRATSTRSTPT